jgi:hypothetical protein
MQREIINPHWINNARTVLAAEFRYADGTVSNAVISQSDNNPDYEEIIKTFGVDVVEANTKENIQKVARTQYEQQAKEQALKDKKVQEELFAMKLKAFEMDIVKDSTNSALKSKIRRSKSDFEVIAYTVSLILSEPAPTEENTGT